MESQTWQSPNVVRYWVRFSKNSGYQGSRIRSAFRSHNLTDGIDVIHKITSDYMPASHQINLHKYYHYPINQAYIHDFQYQNRFHKYTRDHMLFMDWQSNRSKSITVPLVKYGNTIVKLNHKYIHPKRTLIGTMKIESHQGVNHMSISYQPNKLFKVLCFISIVSWMMIAWFAMRKMFKHLLNL